jgi:peptide/nickel transport system permease protein
VQHLTQRLGFFLLTLVFSIVFSFLLMHLAPGDPVDLLLGADAPEIQKSTFRHQLGLDLPLSQQFSSYLSGIFKGDLGFSISYQKPIWDLILTYFPFTILLAFIAMILTVVLGISFGILSAYLSKLPFIHLGLIALSVIGQSTPNFFLGPVLILSFSIYLGWLPVSGFGTPLHIILPALTLSLSLFAIVSRMTAAGLIEERTKDYFTTALAKGRSTGQAFFRHALRNVSIPVSNILGLQLGALFTGAVVTEYIFDWPGIGLLFFSAIEMRDFPLIQSLILVFTVSFSIINFGVDLLNTLLDPRLRSQSYEQA